MKRCSACGRMYRGRGKRIYLSRDGGAALARVMACPGCVSSCVLIMLYTPHLAQGAKVTDERVTTLEAELASAKEREGALRIALDELSRQLERKRKAPAPKAPEVNA